MSVSDHHHAITLRAEHLYTIVVCRSDYVTCGLSNDCSTLEMVVVLLQYILLISNVILLNQHEKSCLL